MICFNQNIFSICALIIIMTISGNKAVCQGSKGDTIQVSEPAVISDDLDFVVIDLNSTILSDYQGNEKFQIFPLGKSALDDRYIPCALADSCESRFRLTPELLISNSKNPFDGKKFPLVVAKGEKIKAGTYLIKVSNEEGRFIHLRKLELNYPKAKADVVEIIHGDGQKMTNQLEIDLQRDMDYLTFNFPIRSLADSHKKVRLGHLELKRETRNRYKSTDKWTVEEIKKLSLDNPHIVIERFFGNDHKYIPVKILSPKPIINNESVLPVDYSKNIFNLKLNVSNLFKDAELILKDVSPDKSVLLQEGIYDGAKINGNDLELEVQLKRGALKSGSAQIQVAVRNQGGEPSEEKAITLSLSEQSVTAEAESSDKPFLAGFKTGVVFTRSESSTAFPRNGQLRISFADTSYLVDIDVDQSNVSQVVTQVSFPKKTNSNSLKFELKTFNDNNNDGDNVTTWTGYFPKINHVPKLNMRVSDSYLYPGKAFYLISEEATNDINVVIDGPFGISQSSPNFETGRMNIVIDPNSVKAGTKFKLKTFYKKIAIDSIEFEVQKWPSPAKELEAEIINDLSQSNSLTLTDTERFSMGEFSSIIAKSSSKKPIDLSAYKLQISSLDGTILGAENLIFNDSLNVYSAKISPFTKGLKGGKEFNLILEAPDNSKVEKRGYLKRVGFFRKVVIQAGFSALNYYTSDTEVNGIDRLSSLNGVSLGAYWIPEWSRSENLRPIGFGFSLLTIPSIDIIENNMPSVRKAGTRVNVGILLFEAISIGAGFGNNLPLSLSVGANITFLDFSKIKPNND